MGLLQVEGVQGWPYQNTIEGYLAMNVTMQHQT